ncbi:MAG: double-strand break repair helicase AddA [Maricaulaceae bacterium]
MSGVDENAYLDAIAAQTAAANPRRDVFVSANAGSGKTYVLVNRVSRILLLDGEVKPEKILCLTYTKAAASEMQSRLFKNLGAWSVMPEAELRGELVEVLGDAELAANFDLKQARELFAKALETPEGLKVQTLHAFCERILSRFPIEAGILPGFDALDDGEARGLHEAVWDGILQAAFDKPESDLAQAIAFLMPITANSTWESLRAWMAQNVYAVQAWDEAGGVEPLAKRLGLKGDETVESLKARIWNDVDKSALELAAKAMVQSGTATQKTKAEGLLAALRGPDAITAFDLYSNALLTAGGTVTTRIWAKKDTADISAFIGTSKDDPSPAMQAIEQAVEDLQSVSILSETNAVLTIAKRFATDYDVRKRARRVLDFNDQIMKVRDLLKNSHVSEWVKYKLDGGIEHILVDEAQDTSPQQWEIVDVLREAFINEAERDPRFPRTMFAVGDEKQSIYSFQGAEPQIFIDKTTAEKTDALRLRMSFRSAPNILRAVDAVFADGNGLQDMFGTDYTAPPPEDSRHTAHRNSVAGLVEIWPAAPAPVGVDEEEPWNPKPLDALSQDSSREALARAIAGQIKMLLDTKEPVTVREKTASGGTQELVRPMQAGDILILVRKRSGSFFNAMIRNLKTHGIAVAGADRLQLSDSIAVQDLTSLAKFACLPSDDLSLAEVLKSPLCDVSEDQLFELATGREGSIWNALQESGAAWAAVITARLKEVLKLSERRAPYEFFSDVLNMRLADGSSILKAFYKRLSLEVQDPIEAFLSRALAHQRRGAPSLQHFVQSFARDNQDLKRELNDGQNVVRVMTVYGAKGLEAPVVILPDTTQVPESKSALDRGMLNLGDNTFARAPSKDKSPEAINKIRDARAAKNEQEYLRLLYVAMTRAESRLLICGYFSGRRTDDNRGQTVNETSWHGRIEAAVKAMDGAHVIDTPFSNEYFTGYAFGGRPEAGANYIATETPAPDLPEWLYRPRHDGEQPVRRVTPSHLLAPPPGLDAPTYSPLDAPTQRFLRGNLIHTLLEFLPDIAPNQRRERAKAFLLGHENLSNSMREDIEAAVMDVLEDARFAAIFAEGSRAEVSLAGRVDSLPESVYLNAQIDRLAVTDSHVYVVDYKSNRPPPKTAHGVAEIYLGQMAAYREMAAALYPNREVICALLWTDRPDFMVLPDALLDAALARIPHAALT